MAKTEAKRKADNKYDLKTYTVLGCKIRKDRAEEFKKACVEAKTSPNAVFKDAINNFMDKHGKSESVEELKREPFIEDA